MVTHTPGKGHAREKGSSMHVASPPPLVTHLNIVQEQTTANSHWMSLCECCVIATPCCPCSPLF